jgi:hypothetical protein
MQACVAPAAWELLGNEREVRVCSVRFDSFGGQEEEDPDTVGLWSGTGAREKYTFWSSGAAFPHLAPTTGVFCRRISMSTIIYSAAGSVASAVRRA